MEVLGLLFFIDGETEEIIFYDDSRDDIVRFKTFVQGTLYEYAYDTNLKEFYRCALTEDCYGDRVREYRFDETIDHVYLIEKELLI